MKPSQRIWEILKRKLPELKTSDGIAYLDLVVAELESIKQYLDEEWERNGGGKGQ